MPVSINIICRRLPGCYYDRGAGVFPFFEDEYEDVINDPHYRGIKVQAKFTLNFESVQFPWAAIQVDKEDSEEVVLDRFSEFDSGCTSLIIRAKPRGSDGYYLHFEDQESVNAAVGLLKMYYQGLYLHIDKLHSKYLGNLILNEKHSRTLQAEQASRTENA